MLCTGGRYECLRCDFLLGFADNECLEMNGERSWKDEKRDFGGGGEDCRGCVLRVGDRLGGRAS